MNDTTNDKKDEEKEEFDFTSPESRGFHPGDDDKLQAAIRANLHAAHEEHVAEGRHEDAAGIKAHLDTLDTIAEIEEREDPNDEIPDDHKIG